MSYVRMIIAVAAIAPLVGCVSIGANYDPAIVDQLTIGMTKAEVIAKLGQPTSSVKLGDGTEQLMWVHSRGAALGTAQARAVMLKFDVAGRYAGLVSQSSTNLR